MITTPEASGREAVRGSRTAVAVTSEQVASETVKAKRQLTITEKTVAVLVMIPVGVAVAL